MLRPASRDRRVPVDHGQHRIPASRTAAEVTPLRGRGAGIEGPCHTSIDFLVMLRLEDWCRPAGGSAGRISAARL